MKNLFAGIRGRMFILKCRMLRKDVHVGQGLRIYKKLSIEGKGSVHIGANCVIDGIKGDSRQYVTIDTHSRDAVVRIGRNACLYAARISAKFEITAGDDLLIEESGIVDTDFHSISKDRGSPANESREKCKISIGNGVCIGAKSYVAKGVTIGDKALIMPGSIVTFSVRPESVVCGNPAKPVNASLPINTGAG
jgi:acetyltransferase-like isoleucine patch superfamily enzyme